MRLSKNFSLKELIKSETATRKNINNNPNEDNIENLQRLCDHVLQPVRDHFGKVVSVSSGNTSLNIKGQPMVNDRADAKAFADEYGVEVVCNG